MSGQQTTSACPHPEAVGTRWRDPIGAERQAELWGYLDRWEAETDHGERIGPFDNTPDGYGVMLTGADVTWLAEHFLNELDFVPDLHLEKANLSKAHLEGAYLDGGVHLEGARLDGAYLTGAYLAGAELEGASLTGAHLEGVTLSNANLKGANLDHAHLERVDLNLAKLNGVMLHQAKLNGANLSQADLKGANLSWADLRGANLHYAELEGAALRGAWLDSTTRVGDASLDSTTVLGDIQWGGVGAVNLTEVDWGHVPTLGDERGVRRRAGAYYYEVVVRAYRQLANQLRAQGINEVADRFTYRSQVWQRRVLLRQGKLGGYLFSFLLAALSGYGYRIGRIVIAYAVIVLLFAAGYFFSGGLPGSADLPIQQQALDALQVSLNAVHGRVFFTQLGLDTLQSWLATAESVIGIVIEGVFVAMLIQRFFGR
jgi:uncharacterized protein YjbI with pentapeptide repeats